VRVLILRVVCITTTVLHPWCTAIVLAACDPIMFTCNTYLKRFVNSCDFFRCFWKSWWSA